MKDFTMGSVTSGPNDGSCCRTWKTRGTILGLFIALVFFSFNDSLYAQTNIQGTAPVQDPNGGFGVDGDARANFPTPGIGDWFAYPGGSGGAIFPAGYELPGADFEGIINFADNDRTYFFRDDISNNDPTIFIGSNKINDDPETYEWGAGSSPNKNEIQTAAAHFTFGGASLGGDPDDLWVIFAADRQVTNGSSYIDFEFLQNSLTRTGTTSGTFVSEGPDMNRTVGDVLVTIEFTQGGGAANAVIRTWQSNGSGGYSYVLYTDYPSGTIYITNNVVETIVPWSVYFTDPIASGDDAGLYQYEINQWAEGAVNLSALFEQDECFNISTLFVRTRTSGSSGQSELKDFPGGPVQLALDLIPDISFTDPDPVCEPATVDLTAIVVDGCDEGTLSYWMNAEATVAVEDPEAVGAGTYYIQCASNVNPICVNIEPVTVVVNPNPEPMVDDEAECEGDTATFNTEDLGTGFSYQWYLNNVIIEGATGYSYTTAALTLEEDGDVYKVRVTNDETLCYGEESGTLTVYANPDPMVGDESACDGDTATFSTADLGAGFSYQWYLNDGIIAGATDYSYTTGALTLASDGDVYKVVVTNDATSCYGDDSGTLTVFENPAPVVDNESECEGDTATFSTSDFGAGFSYQWYLDDVLIPGATNYSYTTGELAFSQSGGVYKVVVTNDSSKCFGEGSGTLTMFENPDCSASNSGPICAGDDVILYETGGDAVEWLWSSDGAATFNDNTLQNPTASGAVDGEIFTVMVTDINGCTSTCTTTVTVEVCMQEGCTLGYWKNHTDQWCDEYSTCDIYGDIFMNAPSELASLSLLEVLNLQGGGMYNLGRQSVAALLNACSDDVQYYYSTPQQVIDYVNAAFMAGGYEVGQAGDQLDMYNEAGCPLGGSSATTAPSDDCPANGGESFDASAGISVSPVPFKDYLNIRYEFGYESDATIQIFDLRGNLVKIHKESNVGFGKVTTLSTDFVRGEQMYIVKVTTSKGTYTKNVVSGGK
ncbi:T9SS type A sorting domain-containing protein [Salinimicrobium xinjiangense]|uniref:T9SS type A sorting domain-containing protein n=1 Tax=Salinimicrobium xinjiangense TaxID=438596 RepID=UPI0012EB11FA|nr:T9SS type A sorting domain-containing protein [Salinimicrobium xinjiangense]